MSRGFTSEWLAEQQGKQVAQAGKKMHQQYLGPGPYAGPKLVTPKRRIRQDHKPLMNRLEQDWFDHLKLNSCFQHLRAQSMRFRLANGAWYKPDITCDTFHYCGSVGRLRAYECKGPKQMKNIARGILTLKFAAAAWPEVLFTLVWRENGVWREQEILP